MERAGVEVWKNTARGQRWFWRFDRIGNDKAFEVRGGSTFTLTTLERQINQEKSAHPSQDLFRNGTFVLIKPSPDTNENEITSPDSYTDNELLVLVRDVQAKTRTVEEIAAPITSPITLGRLHEMLVLEDAEPKSIEFVSTKREEMEGGVEVRRPQRRSSRPTDRIPDTPEDESAGETASPGREIVAEKLK